MTLESRNRMGSFESQFIEIERIKGVVVGEVTSVLFVNCCLLLICETGIQEFFKFICRSLSFRHLHRNETQRTTSLSFMSTRRYYQSARISVLYYS